MTRRSWVELPDGVRHAIETQCGDVANAVDAPAGTACDFAATITTADGPLFCKAVRTDSKRAWMLNNEVRVNKWLPQTAPRVLWDIVTGTWRIVAFENVFGRHAELTPGSPDLDLVAEALNEIAEVDVSSWPVPLQPIEARWDDTGPLEGVNLGNVELYSGSTLLHSDPVTSNLLVADAEERVRVVDWGWPGRGAPWIDTALVVLYLIHLGHTPAGAEEWATQVEAWNAADPMALDAFATTMATLREHQAEVQPASHRPVVAAVARAWAEHRNRP